MVKGCRVSCQALYWDFGDWSAAQRHAQDLVRAGVRIAMTEIDLPGECDAQRAARLEGERDQAVDLYNAALAEAEKLRARLTRKRKAK